MSYSVVSEWAARTDFERLQKIIRGRAVCVWGTGAAARQLKEVLTGKCRIQYFISNYAKEDEVFFGGGAAGSFRQRIAQP